MLAIIPWLGIGHRTSRSGVLARTCYSRDIPTEHRQLFCTIPVALWTAFGIDARSPRAPTKPTRCCNGGSIICAAFRSGPKSTSELLARISLVHRYRSYRADPLAKPLADRHYNRQHPESKNFVPPGRCVVLLTENADALWVTLAPLAQYVRHQWAGAWTCTCFATRARYFRARSSPKP